MMRSDSHSLSPFSVAGAVVVALVGVTGSVRAATPDSYDLFALDWTVERDAQSLRDALDLAGLLDRRDESTRLAFAVDDELAASADLGVMPVTDGWSAALESRGAFLSAAMPSAFAAPGGPTPFAAGAVAGRELLGGVKATGHAGSVAYGLMTFEVDDPSARGAGGPEHVGVGRVVVDLADGLRVGAIATAGDPGYDGERYLFGTDLTLRTTDIIEGRAIEAGFWVQQSMTRAEDDAGGPGSGDGHDALDGAIGFRLAYPNDVVRWSVSFAQIGDEFEAGVGSVPRRGVREYSGLWHCRLRPDGGIIRTIETGVEASVVSHLDRDEAHQRIRVSPVALELTTSDQVRFDYVLHRESRLDATRIGPRVLPPGEYSYGRYEIAANTTPSRPVRVDVRFGGGGYYTGDRVDARVAASWMVTPAVQITAGYEHAAIEIEDATWTSRIVRGNVNFALAPTASWTNAVWYDHVNGTVGVDGRLRWEIEPGNEVVVNVSPRFTVDDAVATDDEVGVVTSLRWSREF